MDYFEEEEQYMSEMTNARMEEEYNYQAMIQNELENEKEKQNELENEEDNKERN